MERLSSPLQLIPRGLLDFFGIKNAGQYPQQLTSQLLSTFDLSDFYNHAKEELYGLQGATISIPEPAGLFHSWTASLSVPAFPYSALTTSIVCPQDETWLLLEYEAMFSMGGINHRGRIAPAYQISLGGANREFVPACATLGQTSQAGVSSPSQAPRSATLQPLWVPPGAILGYVWAEAFDNSPGGTITPTGRMRFVRFRM